MSESTEISSIPARIEVMQSEVVAALNRSEVDIQIATAKTYPRDLTAVLNKIRTYATMDTETAEDCFYTLRRGSGDDKTLIEGISVRLAEIFASAWGNLRVATRIIGNDGRTVTAQGICHDLENNVAVSKEVKRSIVNKYGKTYSEDMQNVTAMAASSIAFRNAVLAVIPKAVTKKVINEIKQVALGKSIDLETSRQRAFDHFKKLGVTEAQILEYLEVKKIEEVDAEMVYELRGLANAIKEGTTTVRDSFQKKAEESERLAEETRKKAEENKLKADQAMQAAMQANGQMQSNVNTPPPPAPETPAPEAPAPEAPAPGTTAGKKPPLPPTTPTLNLK